MAMFLLNTSFKFESDKYITVLGLQICPSHKPVLFPKHEHIPLKQCRVSLHSSVFEQINFIVFPKSIRWLHIIWKI